MTTSEAIDVAASADVQEGRILALHVNDVPLALTRVNGVIRAFGDVCTHDGGPLAEGHIADGCIVCPRHGARFDLLTGKPTFPAVARAPIYPASETNDRVFVVLS